MPNVKGPNSEFGEKLKRIRIEKGMTQKEAAEYIHVTQASFSAYENGVQVPSMAVSIKIAIMFNVSLDWLFGINTITNYDPFDNPFITEQVLRNFVDVVYNKYLISLYTENEDCDFSILHVISESLDEFLRQVDNAMQFSESGILDPAMFREFMDSAYRRYSNSLCNEIRTIREREGQ